MMRLLVLQHEACEPLGIFESLLEKKGIECDYARLYEEKAPAGLDGYDGVIAMGGPMNVYQEKEYPFLKADDRLIKEALKKGKPVLGVCLGAQLMAKALGARVSKGIEKEIGWYKVKLTRGGRMDRIFGGFDPEFMVFQWHGDTFDTPRGATRLAGSALFANQAFRFGKSYALQFHLEVTDEMIRDWLDEYSGEVESLKGKVDPSAILSDTQKYTPLLNALAERFLDGFCQNLILSSKQ